MTATQLSDKTSLSKGYISGLLAGKKGADRSTLVFLSTVLQVSVRWLEHGAGPPRDPVDESTSASGFAASAPSVAHLLEVIRADAALDPFTGLSPGYRERYRARLAEAEQKLEAYAKDLMRGLDDLKERLLAEARLPKSKR